MIQQDNAILVDLPTAQTGEPPQEQQKKRLTISIPNPGIIYVGTELHNLTSLRRIMTECRKNWGEETEVQIRTGKNVPYGEIKPIMQLAAESGIARVSFAVTEK
jgi:biopolymer transport protein ExbD